MFKRDWLREPEFEKWLSGNEGNEYAHCKVCNTDFKCSSKSKVRSHGNGQRHQTLLREHQRNECEARRTSFSGKQPTSNRSRNRSPASSTSDSTSIADSERSSDSSSNEVRERFPDSYDAEIATAAAFIERNLSVRNDGVRYSERRGFLASSTSIGSRARRSVRKSIGY